MEEKEKNVEKTLEGRDARGKFLAGEYEGGPGRPKDTEEDKLRKKALAKIVEDYKKVLFEEADEHKFSISKKLIEKAKAGDLIAIKEINDRILGKAPQQIKGDSENPLIVQISEQAAKKYNVSPFESGTSS